MEFERARWFLISTFSTNIQHSIALRFKMNSDFENQNTFLTNLKSELFYRDFFKLKVSLFFEWFQSDRFSRFGQRYERVKLLVNYKSMIDSAIKVVFILFPFRDIEKSARFGHYHRTPV